MFVTLYEKFPVASERKNTPFFPSKRKCVAVLCHKRCTLHVANDSPTPVGGVGVDERTQCSLPASPVGRRHMTL